MRYIFVRHLAVAAVVDFSKESLINEVCQVGVDFFVRTRWKTGRRVVLCGGFSAEVRAKKIRQDGCTEFISAFLASRNKSRLDV